MMKFMSVLRPVALEGLVCMLDRMRVLRRGRQHDRPAARSSARPSCRLEGIVLVLEP